MYLLRFQSSGRKILGPKYPTIHFITGEFPNHPTCMVPPNMELTLNSEFFGGRTGQSARRKEVYAKELCSRQNLVKMIILINRNVGQSLNSGASAIETTYQSWVINTSNIEHSQFDMQPFFFCRCHKRKRRC
mmetsp:Transcript_1115/g.1430  ORF Transcript_1115/g.1430 Transcript_1115/m.1430 type:complete len:132 (+) Transcript_1115:1558-1953(+)